MRETLRQPFLLLAALVGALALAGSAAAAPAKKQGSSTQPCWSTLINDWYDGRIDNVYPIHCYREALTHLPTDVETYSSARDDINRALQYAIHHQGRSGPTAVTTTGNTTTRSTKTRSTTTRSTTTGDTTTTTGGASTTPGGGTTTDGGSPSAGGSAGGGPGPTSTGNRNKNGIVGQTIRAIGPSKATSVPIPLIVLGGIALLLLASGGVAFAARRLHGRRVPGQPAPVSQPPDAPSGG
jgi:hypothetical protein